MNYLLVFFRIISLALGQPYDCHSTSELAIQHTSPKTILDTRQDSEIFELSINFKSIDTKTLKDIELFYFT